MEDVFVDGILVVADNCLIENGHCLSLLKEDLVEFCGDHTPQICADKLTLCLWKLNALRSVPVEGGRFVAANILQNLPDATTSETSHPPVTSTCRQPSYTKKRQVLAEEEVHSRADTKFMRVFCSAHFCSVFGFSNQEHVVFRLCANVPAIERVVLGAGTDEAFRWASGESFRTELRDIMSKQTLLCMVGCNFDVHVSCFSSDGQTGHWEQLRVVNSIPVCQGRLTETSEIVVQRYSQQHDMSRSCNNRYSSHCDDDAKAVMVSDFAADIANNCSLLASPQLDICLSKRQESSPTHELNFKVLMDIDRMKSLITFQQSHIISDEFSVAVLSRQCASRLGIMNGNMLELSCKSHGQQCCDSRSSAVRLSETCQHACRQKVVIACVDTTLNGDDAVAYISSCAWFNLCSMSCVSLSGSRDTHPCYVKVCEYDGLLTVQLLLCRPMLFHN